MGSRWTFTSEWLVVVLFLLITEAWLSTPYIFPYVGAWALLWAHSSSLHLDVLLKGLRCGPCNGVVLRQRHEGRAAATRETRLTNVHICESQLWSHRIKIDAPNPQTLSLLFLALLCQNLKCNLTANSSVGDWAVLGDITWGNESDFAQLLLEQHKAIQRFSNMQYFPRTVKQTLMCKITFKDTVGFCADRLAISGLFLRN